MSVSSLSIVPASEVHFDDLVNTFNLAYSDYLVPLQLSSDQMRHTHKQTDIDLSRSRVALTDDQIVGLGFLAIREQRAWVGGMGIIPIYRGQGIGRKIMTSLMEQAKHDKLKTVQLEVIETNTPAHNLYLDMGFKQVRRLLIIVNDKPTNTPMNTSIHTVTSQEALAKYEQFHRTQNPWQREHHSLSKAQDLTAWLAKSSEKITSYVLGRITERMIQIMDVAFMEKAESYVKELLTELHLLKPEVPASMVNIAEDDPALPIMQALGFSERLAQIEMIYRIDA